jgi:hypothetical protein
VVDDAWNFSPVSQQMRNFPMKWIREISFRGISRGRDRPATGRSGEWMRGCNAWKVALIRRAAVLSSQFIVLFPQQVEEAT